MVLGADVPETEYYECTAFMILVFMVLVTNAPMTTEVAMEC